MEPEDAGVRELERASERTTAFLCVLTMKEFTVRDSCLFKHLQAPKLFKKGGRVGNPLGIFILNWNKEKDCLAESLIFQLHA